MIGTRMQQPRKGTVGNGGTWSQVFADKARKPNADKNSGGEQTVNEHDNQKLLKLLQSAKGELQGLRLVHLHLSLLEAQDYSAPFIVKNVLAEVSSKSSFFQSFNMSNSDIIILYKGLKLSAITEVCSKIEQVFLSKTSMTRPNPYKEWSLYSIMELSLNFVNVMRFIESLDQETTKTESTTKPPITLEEMAKLERSMQMFDLSPFMLNQQVIDLKGDDGEEQVYFELFISVKALEDRLCPNFDLTANKWLFQYFTAGLDRSVLKSLNYGMDFMAGRRIGININLSTVISSAFVKFDETLPINYRGNVVLEINKVDMIENLNLYREVVDFAQERGYKICIDALNPFWLTHLDVEYLDCDFAKIFWQQDMRDMDEELRRVFKEKCEQQSNCTLILARSETVDSLVFAHTHGIRLVQGRAVDNILRKGVSVGDAIKSALSMDDDDF
jgi:hypothetical protein